MLLFINIWLLIVYISPICLSTSSFEPPEIQIYTNSLRTSNLSTSESIRILSITDRILPLTQTTQPNQRNQRTNPSNQRTNPTNQPKPTNEPTQPTDQRTNSINEPTDETNRVRFQVSKQLRSFSPQLSIPRGLSLQCVNRGRHHS